MHETDSLILGAIGALRRCHLPCLRGVEMRQGGARLRIRPAILVLVAFVASMGAKEEGAMAVTPKWVQRPVVGPFGRAEFAMAYATNRQRTVLFGGSTNLSFSAVNRETWEWDGHIWALVNNADPSPSARCDNAMGFDGAHNEVVSFGGYNGAYLLDTWVWNGIVWVQRMVSGPPNRADSSMAFDAEDAVMIMFGGAASVVRQDTWQWNGTAWQQHLPATVPARRWIHRMAYDSARDFVVMFGGAGTTANLADTWEWDGANWIQRNPPVSPSARYGYGMAYDSKRQVTVMYGGQTGFNFGQGPLNETWEWDGTNWTQLAIVAPPARTFTKMVYDSARCRMVVFGGFGGGQMLSDTWELIAPDGDVNGDLATDLLDVPGFVDAVLAQSTDGPAVCHGDFTGDSVVDGADIAGMVEAVLGQ